MAMPCRCMCVCVCTTHKKTWLPSSDYQIFRAALVSYNISLFEHKHYRYTFLSSLCHQIRCTADCKRIHWEQLCVCVCVCVCGGVAVTASVQLPLQIRLWTAVVQVMMLGPLRQTGEASLRVPADLITHSTQKTCVSFWVFFFFFLLLQMFFLPLFELFFTFTVENERSIKLFKECQREQAQGTPFDL